MTSSPGAIGASEGERVTAAIFVPSTLTVPRKGGAPLASIMDAFRKCRRMPPSPDPAGVPKGAALFFEKHAGAADV
jgi:hypothetical protein